MTVVWFDRHLWIVQERTKFLIYHFNTKSLFTETISDAGCASFSADRYHLSIYCHTGLLHVFDLSFLKNVYVKQDWPLLSSIERIYRIQAAPILGFTYLMDGKSMVYWTDSWICVRYEVPLKVLFFRHSIPNLTADSFGIFAGISSADFRGMIYDRRQSILYYITPSGIEPCSVKDLFCIGYFTQERGLLFFQEHTERYLMLTNDYSRVFKTFPLKRGSRSFLWLFQEDPFINYAFCDGVKATFMTCTGKHKFFNQKCTDVFLSSSNQKWPLIAVPIDEWERKFLM